MTVCFIGLIAALIIFVLWINPTLGPQNLYFVSPISCFLYAKSKLIFTNYVFAVNKVADVTTESFLFEVGLSFGTSDRWSKYSLVIW